MSDFSVPDYLRLKATVHDAERSELDQEVIRLYEVYAEGLLRYAMTMGRDRELARDAVQDCFFRYFLYRQERNEVANPKAWLFRVLRNSLLDRLRAHSNRAEVELDLLSQHADSRPGPEALYDAHQFAQQVPKLLAPREWECLRLRAEGLRYDEIADVLGIRPGTVGALLNRALLKLRVAFREGRP